MASSDKDDLNYMLVRKDDFKAYSLLLLAYVHRMIVYHSQRSNKEVSKELSETVRLHG